MYITNNCSFTLIAFGWRRGLGHGKDTTIPPGKRVEVVGPTTFNTSARSQATVMVGQITCCEKSASDGAFLVGPGNPLCHYDRLKSNAVIVRHADEMRPVINHSQTPHT